MAENITEKAATPRKTAARKPAVRKKAEPAAVAPEKAAEQAAAKPAAKRREFRPDEYVTVRSGYNGRLVYKSSKTGEKFVFESFGSEHDMELQELRKAKNEYKGFFKNNWFLIDDPEVIDYLGVREYYKNALSYEEFDSIADMTAEEISARMALVSEGQKISIAHYVRKMIADGRIDSMKAITALEKGLGVQLIEH